MRQGVGSQRFSASCRSAVFLGVTLADVLGAAVGVQAQALKDVQSPDTPLVLKAQGSFFVGGEKADQTKVELGDLGPGGHIAVNQMYVRFMVPQGGDGNVPVVMVHGATLTGKSWETTPDGRMGWDEYFVRRGHPVYVPDQVGRGRSGFNQAGWPSAVAALDAYDRVYTARNVDTAGLRAVSPRLPAPAPAAARAKAVTEEFGAVAPKFAQLTNEVVFDDLWRRSDLSVRDRSLVTIVAVAAMGEDDQLEFYVRRGLESGLTRGQIAEAVTHLGFYAGWPRATRAMTALTKSFGN
jgi:alkylhydroperoxidase/carboxymuconolactone decarboxylase family protein YurZ